MKNKFTKKKKLPTMSKLQASLSIPYIIFSLVFILLPMTLIFIYAFKPLEGQTNLENWEIIKKPLTWNIIARSIYIGLIAAFVSVLIGFPYAFIVSRSKSKIFKTLALSLILSPMLIFTISKALAVRGLFEAMFDKNALNSKWFMVVGMVYLFLPFSILPIYSVLKDMPNNILEASQDLGYSKFKTMMKVVLPYSLKAILSAFGMVFMLSSTSIIISDKLLPDGSQLQLIGNLINQFANPANPYDLATASTLVIITLLILLALYAIIYGIPYLINKYKQGGNYE
ncbi:ABC transporter permease [Metamycoplasma subdolum]